MKLPLWRRPYFNRQSFLMERARLYSVSPILIVDEKQSFRLVRASKRFGEIKRGCFMAEIHHPEYQIIRFRCAIGSRGNTYAYLFHNGRGFKTKFIT